MMTTVGADYYSLRQLFIRDRKMWYPGNRVTSQFKIKEPNFDPCQIPENALGPCKHTIYCQFTNNMKITPANMSSYIPQPTCISISFPMSQENDQTTLKPAKCSEYLEAKHEIWNLNTHTFWSKFFIGANLLR